MLSFLRGPAFKIRILWLPYYVDNQLVIHWLDSLGMIVVNHCFTLLFCTNDLLNDSRSIWCSLCARIVQVTIYLYSQTMVVTSTNVNMPVGDIVSVSGEAAASGGGEACIGSNRNYIGLQIQHSTKLEPGNSMVDNKMDSFNGESLTEAGKTAVMINNVAYCVACIGCRCIEHRDSALSKQLESTVKLNEYNRWCQVGVY